MTFRVLVSVCVCAFLGSSSAFAQTHTSTLPRRQPVQLTGYGSIGNTSFAATQTFDTVFGTSSAQSFGGGGTISGFWKGLFADMGFSKSSVDGERVFVSGTDVFPLGIPTHASIAPIDIVGGWKVYKARMSSYAGAGFTSVGYKETSAFAASGDDVDERHGGAVILAGADVAIVKWMRVGGEMRYRKISGILGNGGVSEAFGEDDLGGITVALRLTVGR